MRSLVQTLACLGALALILAGCGGAATGQPKPGSAFVPLPAQPAIGTLPAGAASAKAIGPLAATTRLQLTIGLAINSRALAADVAALNDPASSRYSAFLTPAEIASRYGAPQSAVNQVTAALKALGMQVVSVSPLRDSSVISVTAGQIQQVFHLTLQQFQMNGEDFYGPTGQVSLPAQLRSFITYIVGLNNFNRPQADVEQQPLAAASCNAGVTPGQIAAVYQYNSAYRAGYRGDGIGIAALEFDDAVSQNDLRRFLACTTGGQLHYQAVPVDGGVWQSDNQDTFEAELDLEYLSALAPDAQLLEYQSTACVGGDCPDGAPSFTQALLDELHQVAYDHRAQVASLSYGGSERFYSGDELLAIDQALEFLAAEHVTVAIATGDCAAFASGAYGILNVAFPASDPNALAVGGTSLQTNGQGYRASEPAWSSSNPNRSNCGSSWGTGGGLSNRWPWPTWQDIRGVANAASDGARQVPDVAAVATHLPMILGGQLTGAQGTSAAAPIWAAGVALLDQGLLRHRELMGDAQAFYYVATQKASAHPYYDVTQGNNLYYRATPGWDFTTGWGAPNLFNFGQAIGAF